MSNQTVRISGSGTQLSISQDNAHISKSAGDQVHWTSSIAGKTCTVSFSNSPFADSSYSVDSTGTTPSGPVKGSAQAGGTPYKYSVSCPGFNTLDPNVIVDN
jgi:hypothetical protein